MCGSDEMRAVSTSSARSPVATARAVVDVISEREVTFLAASISYYTLVSLIPLLVLALVVATVVGGEALATQVQALVEENLPAASDLVADALADQTGQSSLGLLSLALTLWGALKVFRGLDKAFTSIYGGPARGILNQVVDGAVALVSIVLGLFGVVALGTVIAIIDFPFVTLLAPAALLAALSLAFLPLYYVFPDVSEISVREALPGAVVAAVGWTALGTLFGVYAEASGGSVAGALGALLLLVTWFYLSGIVLLSGVAVNVVLAGRVGGDAVDDSDRDRQVQQGPVRGVSHTDMSADEQDGESTVEPRGAPDIEQLEDRVEELRADLDAFEHDVDERTVKRPELEAELKRYVRGRMRRGHARGWGPYLVLLYGVMLALGAFFFLDGVWAIAAMVVTFLSTLGLYVVFIAVGTGLNVLGVPGKALDFARDRKN